MQSKNTSNISFTTLGLIKFLLYGDYLKAKAFNGSFKSLVQDDLGKYGYKAKDPFEVMQTHVGNGSGLRYGCILGALHQRLGSGREIQFLGGPHRCRDSGGILKLSA